jgi:type II secretion system (T2SS) protein M
MMSLDRLKPEAQRTLAAAVPAVVLLFTAFLVVPKAMEYSAVRRQAAICQKEAELRKRQNLTELAAEGRQQLSAWPQTRTEPLAFLKELNRMVADSRARLVSYRPPAVVGSGAASAAPSAGNEALVKPIGCEVTVSGSFVELVTLFQSLSRDGRLFTVEDLQVRTETYPRLSAAFRLVRYVTPVTVALAQTRGAAIMKTASAALSERPAQ